MASQFSQESISLAFYIMVITGIGLGLAFVYIIWSYAKGLRGSPRELWLLFTSKLVEYSAYGAINMTFVLFLRADCGLSDIFAGSYIAVWSSLLTVVTVLVGAVVDAIGIKKTLLMGTVFLIFGRFFMPLTNNIYLVSLLGFIPMAVGTAIMGPVLSVGIKHYTTREGATLGFALFYTMMNIGWALGALIFDEVRIAFGEHTMVPVFAGLEMSTYQIIFLVGFILTIPTMLMVLAFRDGIWRNDDGKVVVRAVMERPEGNLVNASIAVAKKASRDTGQILKEVVRQKAFWVFLFMLGLLVFVRMTFFHFHYTFPTYGIRVLGEGVKVGNIYGFLNPMMVVFLVPFIAALTVKVRSYKMMLIGTWISAGAVFIATMPPEIFSPLMDTWFGYIVFEKWLNVSVELRDPFFLSLIFFIALFSVGEAFWSPRLMQFTAEIAPPGREGSYIALSYLPYFAAKLVVGPMSGWLLATYTPEGAASYPYHYMVWVWIGGMALLSPIGLVIFRGLYIAAERRAAEQSAAISAETED